MHYKAMLTNLGHQRLTLKMFGKMLIGEVSWKNITGPITIADYAGQTARIGMISYLSFIAFISISLGSNEFAPYSGVGWRAFAVLFRGSFDRTPCF